MIVRITGILLAAAILFTLLLFGVLSSTAGNRLIVSLIEKQVAPGLSVLDLSGSLLGELCAEEIRYEGDGFDLLLLEVCVDPELWTSIDFLTISLASVRAGSLRIRTWASEGAEASGSPELPLPVSVDLVSLGRLEVNDIVLTNVEADLDLSNDDFELQGGFVFETIPVMLETAGPLTGFRMSAQALGSMLTGEVNLLADGIPWQLELTAANLDLERFIDRSLLLGDVRVQASGDMTGYDFSLFSRFDDPLGAGRLQSGGSGDWQHLELRGLELSGLELAEQPVTVDVLTADGIIRWAEGIFAEFTQIAARGRVAEQHLDAIIERLRIDGKTVTVESGSAMLAAGGRLDVDGQLGFEGGVEASIEGSGLPMALAGAGFGGQVGLSVSLAGPVGNPMLRGTASIASLVIGERDAGDLDASFEGTPENGRVRLSLDTGRGGLDTAFRYLVSGRQVAIAVEEAAAGYPELEATARLEQPVEILIDEGHVLAGEFCLLLQSGRIEAEPGRLCGALSYPDGGMTLTLDGWDMPDIRLPESSASVTGKVTAHVSVTEFSPTRGEAEVSFADLVASHPDLEPLQLGDLTMTVDLTEDLATATLATPEGETQELLLTGTVTSELSPIPEESSLQGSLYLELNGIWVAEGLLPMDVTYELDKIRGIMGVNAQIRGTVGDPVVDGILSLRDAGWEVLATNTEVRNLNLKATLSESRTLSFESESSVGDGSVSFQGALDGLDTDAPRLRTEVSASAADVLNLPDYQATIDGKVALEMGTDDLLVEGLVTLTRAAILIADLPETAISASADEIIIDEEQTAGIQQLRTTDLTLTLGDEVFLEAFGLRGRLSGNLRLRESPGRLQSVTGVISLREAEFEAYGQVLRVERGQLTFAGPIENPAVDVVATRVVTYEERDYRVSLLISGTAENLETEVVSQPALAEDDALALLITGRTFSQINSSERTNVSGAALSMGILSATGVTQNVATALNLEEIIVDQDTEGNMEVGAAVRLNRNLYLRYTYGVFSRLGGVLLRYRLNPRISVQAKTGDAHSIEIRYGVDE